MRTLLKRRCLRRRWLIVAGASFGLGISVICCQAGFTVWNTHQTLLDVGRVLLGHETVDVPERHETPRLTAYSSRTAPIHKEEDRPLGALAQECTLHDVDGKIVKIKDYVGKMPVVVEFASFT